MPVFDLYWQSREDCCLTMPNADVYCRLLAGPDDETRFKAPNKPVQKHLQIIRQNSLGMTECRPEGLYLIYGCMAVEAGMGRLCKENKRDSLL